MNLNAAETAQTRAVAVDATTRSITCSPLEDAVRRRYLGGSYLATHLWLESSRLEVDPLSAANALVIAPGLLTGFPIIAANRTSLVSKSPQTGLLSESTVGGFFGAKMKAAGVDALVIKGSFDVPSYIIIDGDSGTVEVEDAGALWGQDIFRTFEVLKERHGEDLDAAVIGPAGENGVYFAAVIFGGIDSRAAGRTGMGAVMGSKNLKAVVVRGGKTPKPADREGLTQAMREFMVQVRERAIPWGKYGTSGGVISAEAIGDLPVDNWRGGSFPGVSRITGQTMAEQGMVIGHYSCWGCPIRCGKDVRLGVGDRAGQKSHGPEYETIGAFGSLCMLDDPQYIAAENLGKKLSEATDGRYSIEVYANETLGTQADVVNNVSDGSVDMMYIGGPVMESFNQDFIVFNLPYMFDSLEAQDAVFSDDEVMGELKKSIEAYRDIAGFDISKNPGITVAGTFRS